MQDGLIVIDATLEAFDGQAPRLAALMREAQRESRLETGCLTYRFMRDLDAASLFYVLEIWENESALMAHLAGDPFKAFVAGLADCGRLVSSDRRIGAMEPFEMPRPAGAGRMIDSRANRSVVQALHNAIDNRGEIGVQVAAYLGGELVTDAWAGVADQASGRPVDGDTLFNVFSVSKAVAATAVHVQAEHGLLDYDEPVARYWPEFGANGKDDITVRDVLNHHTGTPQMPEGTTPESICDWDATAAGIAALTPILPKNKPAYQAMSFGWILGEIVRRTDPDHRDFRTFIREEIAAPYGIDDLWMGIDPEVAPRMATLVDEESSRAAPDGSLFAGALPNTVRLIPPVFNLPAVRMACLPAVGGVFSARSEARFWAILAGGGTLDGRKLLSQDRVVAACQPRPGGDEPDPVYFNAPMTLAQGGFWKPSDSGMTCAAKGSPLSICVPGAGGSLGWADPETGLAVAFCHNRMFRPTDCDSHPLTAIAGVIRAELGL